MLKAFLFISKRIIYFEITNFLLNKYDWVQSYGKSDPVTLSETLADNGGRSAPSGTTPNEETLATDIDGSIAANGVNPVRL
jgi:hypothetical protein